jgi:hypothetical protein
MALVLAILSFAAFTANVALGASGVAVPLSDVGEMLVLLAASTFFVVAVLKKEADRRNKSDG